jgi:quinol monooxygenase YgiN
LKRRAEPGCIEYAYAIDLLDPTLVRISERWTTRAALAAHSKAPHLAEWRSHWPRLRITDRSLRLYEGEPEVI